MARKRNDRPKQTAFGSATVAQKVPEVKQALAKMNSGTRRQPKKVTQKHIDTLWAQIAGGKGMAAACSDPRNNLPSRQAIMKYLGQNPEANAYLKEAYEWHAHHQAEFIVDVASGGVHSTQNVERDKLIVSTVKWLAGKYNRKDFGEQMNVAVQSDGPAIILPTGFGGGILSGQVIDAEAIPYKPQDNPDDTKA